MPAIVSGGTASGARLPPSFVILRVIPPPGAAVGIGAGCWPRADTAAAKAAAAKEKNKRRRFRRDRLGGRRDAEWNVIRKSDGRRGDLRRTRTVRVAEGWKPTPRVGRPGLRKASRWCVPPRLR